MLEMMMMMICDSKAVTIVLAPIFLHFTIQFIYMRKLKQCFMLVTIDMLCFLHF